MTVDPADLVSAAWRYFSIPAPARIIGDLTADDSVRIDEYPCETDREHGKSRDPER